MLFVSLTDATGNRIQVIVNNIAWFGADPSGKGTILHFAVPGEGGLATLKVRDSLDEITTQINAKLRK